MKLKSRKGSTLLLTLMVFAILMIFVTFISGFMLTENKQAMFHQNKMQAYYIARGGAEAVEAAILGMDEDGVEELEDKLKNGIVDIGQLDIGGNKAYVTVSKDGENILIESVGYAGDTSEKATKVMGKVVVDSQTAEIEYAVFASSSIIFKSQTQQNIVGDIGINAENGGKIEFGNNGFKNSTIVHIPKGSNPEDIFEGKATNSSNDPVIKYIEKRTYPEFDFPLFPTLPVNNSNYNFELGGVNVHTIKSSIDYNKLSISGSSRLNIDTTAGDIIINAKELNLSGSGVINITGGNKLVINVGDLEIGGSGRINNTLGSKYLTIHQYANKFDIGRSQKIEGNIYVEKADVSIDGSASVVGSLYSKGNNVSLSGAQSIVGDIYIEKGDLTISGSGRVHGSIFSNGNSVKLSGSGIMAQGVLYAPNADVELSGSGSVVGAVISRNTILTGGGKIEYNSNYIDEIIIPTSPSYSKDTKYKSAYYK